MNLSYISKLERRTVVNNHPLAELMHPTSHGHESGRMSSIYAFEYIAKLLPVWWNMAGDIWQVHFHEFEFACDIRNCIAPHGMLYSRSLCRGRHET